MNTTIIATVILIGLFSLLHVTIRRSGVEEALKLWNGLWALPGLGIGAMISFCGRI